MFELSALSFLHKKQSTSTIHPPESPMSANVAFHSKNHGITVMDISFHIKLVVDSMNDTYSGRGRGRARSLHQLCGRSGDTVQKCYHSFHISFSGHSNSSNVSGQSSGTNNSSSNAQVGDMTAMVATQPELVTTIVGFLIPAP